MGSLPNNRFISAKLCDCEMGVSKVKVLRSSIYDLNISVVILRKNKTRGFLIKGMIEAGPLGSENVHQSCANMLKQPVVKIICLRM